MTVRFVNKETGEIREQRVFMWATSMMTEWGTFIINGTERVIVTQPVRSPRLPDGAQGRDEAGLHQAVRMCRAAAPGSSSRSTRRGSSTPASTGRKLPVTTLLRALAREDYNDGLALDSNEDLLKLFDNSPLHPEHAGQGHDDPRGRGVVEVFKKQRPGEPPTLDNSRNLVRALSST